MSNGKKKIASVGNYIGYFSLLEYSVKTFIIKFDKLLCSNLAISSNFVLSSSGHLKVKFFDEVAIISPPINIISYNKKQSNIIKSKFK